MFIFYLKKTKHFNLIYKFFIKRCLNYIILLTLSEFKKFFCLYICRDYENLRNYIILKKINPPD